MPTQMDIEFSEKMSLELEVMARLAGMSEGEIIRLALSLLAVHVQEKNPIVIRVGTFKYVPFIIPDKLGPFYMNVGEKKSFSLSDDMASLIGAICRRENIDERTAFMKALFVLSRHLEVISRRQTVYITGGFLGLKLKLRAKLPVKLDGPYTASREGE